LFNLREKQLKTFSGWTDGDVDQHEDGCALLFDDVGAHSKVVEVAVVEEHDAQLGFYESKFFLVVHARDAAPEENEISSALSE